LKSTFIVSVGNRETHAIFYDTIFSEEEYFSVEEWVLMFH